MTSPKIDRRTLLRGAGAGAAGALVAGAVTASASGEEPLRLSGTVESTSRDSMQLRQKNDAVTVILAPGGIVWRDQAVALTDFEHGDEVVATGDWSDDTFVATQVEILGRLMEVEIEDRHDDLLVTDGDDVQLTSRSESSTHHGASAEDLDDLRKGDDIVVEGRRDSESGDLLAWTVGVRKG